MKKSLLIVLIGIFFFVAQDSFSKPRYRLDKFKAQLRIQGIGSFNKISSTLFAASAARLWMEGKKDGFGFGFEPDFAVNKLFNLYFSFFPKETLEIRFGRSWLPKLGEYSAGPFWLDTVNFPEGFNLIPARDAGIFAIWQPGKKFEGYLSLVNGNGSDFKDNNGFDFSDNNHAKDIFGSFMFTPNKRWKLSAGFYQEIGPNNSPYSNKRRAAAHVVWNISKLLTLKTAFIAGKDSVETDAGFIRSIIHFRRLDAVAEYDYAKRDDIKTRVFTLGLNFPLPVKNGFFIVNVRRFLAPKNEYDVSFLLQGFFSISK